MRTPYDYLISSDYANNTVPTLLLTKLCRTVPRLSRIIKTPFEDLLKAKQLLNIKIKTNSSYLLCIQSTI